MPVATPNRVAHPVSLEAYVPPCKLVQVSGLVLPYHNSSATDSIIAGEPIEAFGRICIAQNTIEPGKMGALVTEWVVDALLDTAHTGDILQNALVYWDTDVDIVTPIDTGKHGTAAIAGIGGAVASVPTNGLMLGRALLPHYEHDAPVNGSNVAKAGETGKLRVRVASIPGAPTTYSA